MGHVITDKVCRAQQESARMILAIRDDYTAYDIRGSEHAGYRGVSITNYNPILRYLEANKRGTNDIVVIIVPETEIVEPRGGERGRDVLSRIDSFLKKERELEVVFQTLHHSGFFVHVSPRQWRYPNEEKTAGESGSYLDKRQMK